VFFKKKGVNLFLKKVTKTKNHVVKIISEIPNILDYHI
jgi:hypothetical protein